MTRYPGYSHAWGSTKMWERVTLGPFVSVTYTPPDDRGMSIRVETFHGTLAEAERRSQ